MMIVAAQHSSAMMSFISFEKKLLIFFQSTIRLIIIRPPGTSVPGRAYVLPVMYLLSFFFFFRHSFSELPRLIALKLCHLIGICVYFRMQVYYQKSTIPVV